MPVHTLANKQTFKESPEFKKWVKGDVQFCENIHTVDSPEWVVISKWNGLYDIHRFWPLSFHTGNGVTQDLSRATEEKVFAKLYEITQE